MSLPPASPQNASGLTFLPPDPGHVRPVEGATLAAALALYHASATPLAFHDLLRRYLAACRHLAWAHGQARSHPGPTPETIVTDASGSTYLIAWGEHAPAAADSESVASNIHAMGAVLYTLLTGIPPPADPPSAPPALRESDRLPWPPGALARTVPSSLEAVCLKALDPDPAWRYPDMFHLARDVERFLAGLPVQAEHLSPWQRLVRRLAHPPWPARLALAVLLLAAGLLLGAWSNRSLSRQAVREHLASQEQARRAEQQAELLSRTSARLAQALIHAQHSHAQLRQTLVLLRTLAARTRPAPGDPPPTLALKQDTAAVLAEAARSLEPALPPAAPGNREAVLDRMLLGEVYLALGQGEPAARLFSGAAVVLQPTGDRPPSDPATLQLLLGLHRSLGQAHLLRRRLDDAAEAFREAVRQAEQLRQASPGNPQVLQELAGSREQLGRTLLLHDRPGPAAEQAAQLLTLAEEQLKADPASVQGRQHKTAALALQGDVLHKDYRLDEALKCYEQAAAMLTGLDAPTLRQGLDRAGEDCRQGLRAADDLAWALNQPPGQSLRCLWLRTAMLVRRGRLDQAIATVEVLRAQKPKDSDNLYNVACGYALCAAAVGAGRPERALAPADRAARQAHIRKAVAALEDAVAHGWFDLAHLRADPDLTSLRTDPGYRRLEAALRARPAWFVPPGPF